jgi:hypothetical protein
VCAANSLLVTALVWALYVLSVAVHIEQVLDLSSNDISSEEFFNIMHVYLAAGALLPVNSLNTAGLILHCTCNVLEAAHLMHVLCGCDTCMGMWCRQSALFCSLVEELCASPMQHALVARMAMCQVETRQHAL